MKKALSVIISACLVGAMALSMAGCKAKDDTTKIGIAMPTKSLERWNRDGSFLEEEFKKLGYEVELKYSDNDVTQQVSDIENLISRADISVHVASNEGLPRVVIQYVLTGKPCLVTHLPGIERIVANGVNGEHFPSNCIEILAARLIALMSDSAKLRAYAEEAKRMDLSAWGVETMLETINEAYGIAQR